MSQVATYLDAVEHPQRKADAIRLDQIMQDATGFQPRLWGKIIGYGRYHYRYDSGREGEFATCSFHPQKARLSIYIMPGYTDFGDILDRLGKHKRAKACLYINKLADVDETVVADLIRAGVADLARRWPITPT